MALYDSAQDVFTFTIQIFEGGRVRIMIENIVPVEQVSDVFQTAGKLVEAARSPNPFDEVFIFINNYIHGIIFM